MKKLRTLKIGRYISLLLVLVIAVAYVNIWFYQSFKNQATEVNDYVQEQIISRISEYYEGINAFIIGSMSDNEIQQLQNFSDKSQLYGSETVSSIVSKLRTNSSKTTMIKKAYIYLDDLDMVLCSSGIIDTDTFYEIEAKKYFSSYDSWMKAIKTENNKKNFFTNDKSIMFSFMLDGTTNFDSNKRKMFIGAFSDKKDVFIKTPHIDWINKCNIYVYDGNGEISLSEENIEIEGLDNDKSYPEILSVSANYDTLSYDAVVNDYKYHIVVAFEKNFNMKTVKKVQAVSIFTTTALFLLVLYYFFNLYSKRYKPLKAISKILGINVDKIDYTLIEKPIENIVEKNQLLNQLLEKNNTNLKLIILKRLLTGDLSKEFMKDLENLGIKFTKEGCFVVAIHLYTDSDITEKDNLSLISAVEDEIKAIIEEDGAVYFVLEKQYIVAICNTEKDFNLDKFSSSIFDVIRELENNYDFVASIAISNMHTRYWHISKAYAESMEALSNDELYDKSKMIFYRDVIGNETARKFSMEEETRLTEAIKTGKSEDAKAIITNAIGRINSEKTFLYMNISVGLVYSLMRIADLLFGENFDTHSVAYLLKNTDDLTVLSSACCEFAEKMCEASKNIQGENKIANKVREYIHSNYSNSQLTARIIAEEMNYSFVYINNLFKQEYSSTIVAYLNYYRIEKAKELMMQNIPVNEAAKAVGILSIRTFNRQFQSLTGMTPTEYKKNAIGKEKTHE